MKIRIDINLKDLKVNRVIRSFIAADFLFFGGWGLVNPVFALFVVDRIPGAGLMTVGIAAALYWFVKSLFQIPVSILLDRYEGERDDFHVLILSLILAGIAMFLFLIARTQVGLFGVVILQAVAFGLYTPSWSALFARHLDREHYSFDWSLDSTSVGIAAGVTGLLGGGLASLFGFEIIFIGGGILSFASAFLLLLVPDVVFPRRTSAEPLIRDHTPVNINK